MSLGNLAVQAGGAAERVDITLPRQVLKRLDALARAAGESRSAYIAHLTLEEPNSV